jgi:integrase/recombinase XerD
MPGKQAKILPDQAIEDLLFFAETTRHPVRNRVIVLLSTKAGLRAAEIACLTWEMLLAADGEIGATIELLDSAAKMGHGRRLPIHDDLRRALIDLREVSLGDGPVIRSERGGRMTPLSVVIWFSRAFQATGLEGCSSHSGRRTFITRAARLPEIANVPKTCDGRCPCPPGHDLTIGPVANHHSATTGPPP